MIYNVADHGMVMGEDEMKSEIYENGPIACSLYAHADSFDQYRGGVIQDSGDYDGNITHVVTILVRSREVGC